MSRYKKRLNIQNSNRKYNLNLIHVNDIIDKVKVTRLNEDEIEEEMDKLEAESKRIPKRDDNSYIMYQEKYTNDKLIDKVINHSGGVSYYTRTVVPYYVIKSLSMHPNSEVIYSMRKKFEPREIENVETAFMATEVVIDVPIVIPDMSPYDILFSLHDLKTNVDFIQMSFPPLREEEIAERHKAYYTKKDDGLYHLDAKPKFDYFKYVQTSLSTWAMNLQIISRSEEEYEELDVHIQRDKDIRNPNRKKKKRKEADDDGEKSA